MSMLKNLVGKTIRQIGITENPFDGTASIEIKVAPEPPTAERDVPEWQKQIAVRIRDRIRATGCWSAEFVEQVVREECEPLEAEISRRVAEATAEKEAGYKKALDALDSAIKRNFAVHEAREAQLTQAIAQRDAECERFRKELTKTGKLLCPRMPGPGRTIAIGYFTVADSAEKALRHLEKQLAAAQAEVERLKAELAESRKPVNCRVRCGAAATFNPAAWVVTEADYQAERNARLAAERERDELREAFEWYPHGPGGLVVKTHEGDYEAFVLGSYKGRFKTRIDAVLAAFRSRQEGVKSNG